MAFIESPRFPDEIAYGSTFAPGWRTSVVTLDSGAEERVGFWSAPRHSFNIQHGIRDYADMKAVREFYVIRRGPAVAFRFKDFTDYSSSASATPNSSTPANTDQTIGTGDGTTTTFQLVKVYSDAGGSVTRNITKPVASTTIISLDSVSQPTGWTVDTTTGIVTFSVAPTLGQVVKAGFHFDVPVRFGSDIDAALPMSVDSFESSALPPIALVEVISEAPCSEEIPTGGAATVALAASGSFTRATGRLIKVTPAGAGLVYTQSEDEADMPLGGPHHRIHNAGSDSLDLHGLGGGLIAALPGGSSVEMWMSDAGGGTKAWAVFP